MSAAYLSVRGEKFDVDLFLGGTSLSPDTVFHHGQPTKNIVSKLTPERICQFSGFSIEIGGVFGRLLPQIEEVIKFFEENHEELVRLHHFPGVTDIRVVLSYSPGNAANVCELLPSEMLKVLSSVGVAIELSVYPGDDKWIDEEYGKIPSSWKGP
jgi:hypothetical protein